MHRIGWNFPSAMEVVDDRGVSWNFLLDSLAAIGEACRRAVRRWRLSRIGRLIPSLVPQRVDLGSGRVSDCADGTILVDFAATVGQLLKSKNAVNEDSHTWSPCWRGDLASALSGGQWPQARKAAVPSWGIDDPRCQRAPKVVGEARHKMLVLPGGG